MTLTFATCNHMGVHCITKVCNCNNLLQDKLRNTWTDKPTDSVNPRPVMAPCYLHTLVFANGFVQDNAVWQDKG